MIGNNRYVADIISKKEGSPSSDAHEIEMILNEYWRYIKHLQKYSNYTSIALPKLGRFNFKMGKGNLTIKHHTKQLEAIRNSKSYKEDNEKALVFTKLFQDQLDATLKQKETLTEVFNIRTAAWEKKKALKELNKV